MSKEYLVRSTGLAVGCCGGWVGSGSWVVNKVIFNATSQPSVWHISASPCSKHKHTLSELLSAIIHQRTAWHRVRQIGWIERCVHTKTSCGKQRQVLFFHSLLWLTCCHCHLLFPLKRFQYICPACAMFDKELCHCWSPEISHYINCMHTHSCITSYRWTTKLPNWKKLHLFTGSSKSGPHSFNMEGEECSRWCKQVSLDNDGFWPQRKAN